MAWDPNNVPLLYDYDDELMNEEYLSNIYVPHDPVKQALTDPRQEEAPRDSENGRIFFAAVENADGFEARFGVYLPYGFDEDRAEPYPVLVIAHGGGGTESSWFGNGALRHILDNMIAEERLEPTVVVAINATDSSRQGTSGFHWDRKLILDNTVDYLLPYMVENYNVATDMKRRAFAGLSMGGATVMYGYFHYTNEFQYYMALSSPMLEEVAPDYSKPELQDVKLFLGYGMYDFVKMRAILRPRTNPEGSVYEYIYDLGDAGIPFTNREFSYGHDWVLWRKLAVHVFDNFLWQ